QQIAEVGASILKPLPDLTNPGSIEKGRLGLSAEQHILRPGTEWSFQPRYDWDAKSHFGCIQESIGKQGHHRPAQEIFPPAISELHVHGQRVSKLHHLVVQERYADLKRVRHAGPIDLGEDIVDERGFQIQKTGFRKKIGARRAIINFTKAVERVIPRQLTLKVAGKYAASKRSVSNGDSVEVAVPCSECSLMQGAEQAL